jgi:hypothetical protein
VANEKDEFDPLSAELTVSGGSIAGPNFVRVNARIWGKVIDENAEGIPENLSRRLLNEQIEGIAGVTIIATCPGRPNLETTTAADGTYQLEGAADGDWTIWALKDGCDFDPPSRRGSVAGAHVARDFYTAVTKEIDVGFVFYRGAYIVPPYRIRVVDGGIKINNVWAQAPPEPIREKNIIRAAKEDPGPFKWTPEFLAKGTLPEEFNAHAFSRFNYWQAQYGYDEACNRFEAYLKEQPLVARTERRGLRMVEILYWTKDGHRDGYMLLPSLGRRMVFTDPEEHLRRTGRVYHWMLGSGGAIFISRGELTMPPPNAARKLPRIYDIVTSNLEATEKAAALVNQRLILDPRMAEELVAGLIVTTALKERIDALRDMDTHMQRPPRFPEMPPR